MKSSAAVAIHRFIVYGMQSNQAKIKAKVLNDHPDVSVIALCVNDADIPLKACLKVDDVL